MIKLRGKLQLKLQESYMAVAGHSVLLICLLGMIFWFPEAQILQRDYSSTTTKKSIVMD